MRIDSQQRFGSAKRDHCQRGLFTGGISKLSKFSRISGKWLESPLFSTVWGFPRISSISKFSRISSEPKQLSSTVLKDRNFTNI